MKVKNNPVYRKAASDFNRAAGYKTYWYYVVDDYCPVCGRSDTYRERIYGERPKDWEQRHEFNEVYDGCTY